MRLYTICLHAVPVVVLSAGAEPPVEDAMLTDPAFMKALRDSQADRDQLESAARSISGISPEELQHGADLIEIEEAIDTWLREDLLAILHNGSPIWDGNRESLNVRAAKTEEAMRWHDSRQKAIATGEQDAGHEDWIVFLVSV